MSDSVYTELCNRCFGRGFFSNRRHVEGGVCFACNGRGKLRAGTNRRYAAAPGFDAPAFRIIRNNASSDFTQHSWVIESKRSGLCLEITGATAEGTVRFETGFPEEAKERAEAWARGLLRCHIHMNVNGASTTGDGNLAKLFATGQVTA